MLNKFKFFLKNQMEFCKNSMIFLKNSTILQKKLKEMAQKLNFPVVLTTFYNRKTAHKKAWSKINSGPL